MTYSSDKARSSDDKQPKAIILRCDRPRYDGGVDVNLERYFGRPLQPSKTLLEQRIRKQLATQSRAINPVPEAHSKQPENSSKASAPKMTEAIEKKAAVKPDTANKPEDKPTSEKKPGWLKRVLYKLSAEVLELSAMLAMMQLLVIILLQTRSRLKHGFKGSVEVAMASVYLRQLLNKAATI